MTRAAEAGEIGVAGLGEAVCRRLRAVLGPGPAPLHEPELAGREAEYLRDCVESGWVSSLGAYVERFEAMLQDYTGAGHATATVNGTAALHLALVAAGVRRGDEVLVPALTFVATANAVSYCGAEPHFVDSDPATLGVDPARLADHLAEITHLENGVCRNRATGRPIRALVAVHVLGHPADLDPLAETCARHHLALVEDAAESLGSFYKGRHTGTCGRLGALSFNGNKVITTGGGGAVLTADTELARRARHLATTARIPAGSGFVHDAVGYNYRLPNVNAALGCAQLESLEALLARKRQLAERYRAAFADLDGARPVAEPAYARSNWWLNALMLEGGADRRDAVIEATNAAGYNTRPTWTPLPRLAMYARCPRMPLAGAEEIFAKLVCLPSSARHGGEANE